jgi:hypothetical protein
MHPWPLCGQFERKKPAAAGIMIHGMTEQYLHDGILCDKHGFHHESDECISLVQSIVAVQESSVSGIILYRIFPFQDLSFTGIFLFRNYPFQDLSFTGIFLFRNYPFQERSLKQALSCTGIFLLRIDPLREFSFSGTMHDSNFPYQKLVLADSFFFMPAAISFRCNVWILTVQRG